MGEKYLYQPLTSKDKITVVLYRLGIVMSTVIISIIAYLLMSREQFYNDSQINTIANFLLISLYVSIGMSVFFIHLYVSRFHRALKNLYYISLIGLLLLYAVSKGDIIGFISGNHGALLLIPLSCCLGFITAKEAFCFKLIEGYIVALIMPVLLVFLSAGIVSMEGLSIGAAAISGMLIFFTMRKVFMPLHFDIGDKSAYC